MAEPKEKMASPEKNKLAHEALKKLISDLEGVQEYGKKYLKLQPWQQIMLRPTMTYIASETIEILAELNKVFPKSPKN